MPKNAAPSLVEVLDLRSLTRDSDKILTTILVLNPHTMNFTPWILCGAVQLMPRDGARVRQWDLGARYAHGISDGEHDTAWAFKLEVVGAELRMMGAPWVGTVVTGWIAADSDELKLSDGNFNVPVHGYDPCTDSTTTTCPGGSECSWEYNGPHPIVDRYVPRHNAALYQRLRGRAIEIRTGLAVDAEVDV